MNASKRIQWLHKYIVEMRYPNAGRLAERFGISHRQAQRDVDSLRNNLGAPLAYSAEHRGFYYTADYSLPSYAMAANEFDYVEAVKLLAARCGVTVPEDDTQSRSGIRKSRMLEMNKEV